MSTKYPRIGPYGIECNASIKNVEIGKDSRGKRTWHHVSNMRLKCSKKGCGKSPVVAKITVQISWTRGDDEVFYLCEEHYKESGARSLPSKSPIASGEGREEELLRYLDMY